MNTSLPSSRSVSAEGSGDEDVHGYDWYLTIGVPRVKSYSVNLSMLTRNIIEPSWGNRTRGGSVPTDRIRDHRSR